MTKKAEDILSKAVQTRALRRPMDLVHIIFIVLLLGSTITLCIPVFTLSYFVSERERVEALDGALKQSEVAILALSYVSPKDHADALMGLMESTGLMIETAPKSEAFEPIDQKLEARLRKVHKTDAVLAQKRAQVEGFWIGYDINETMRLWCYAPVNYTHPSIFQTSILIIWGAVIIALFACYPVAKLLSKDFAHITKIAKFIEFKNTATISEAQIKSKWKNAHKNFIHQQQESHIPVFNEDVQKILNYTGEKLTSKELVPISQKVLPQSSENDSEEIENKNFSELKNNCHSKGERGEMVNQNNLCKKKHQYLSKEGFFVGRLMERISERLDATARVRSMNLSALAHDLKSPISRVRLAAEVEDDESRLRSMIQEQMDLMNELISDFVQWAENESACIEPFDINIALAHAITRLHTENEREINVELHSEINATIASVFVLGNHVLLGRSILNIIDNHFKYGAGVSLFNVFINKDEEVQIEIKDYSGTEGPSAEEMLLLCAPFERADSARNKPGTGLGLAIALQGVQICGGTLNFERDLQGLNVVLRIPIIHRI